jgi:amino acid transporter
MTALGEMAAWIPHASGFAGYATRFVDPALGFALGWTYWCKYIITTPNQLTATALIIQEWKTREQVNPGVWIAIFLVAVLAINYFGIRFFGELEFWLSSIKVVTIVSIVVHDAKRPKLILLDRSASFSSRFSLLLVPVHRLRLASSTTRNLVRSRHTSTKVALANSTASGLL